MNLKLGQITCLGLGAVCLLSAAVIFTSKTADPQAAMNEVRSSITLYNNKKMYADAVAKYKELVSLDPGNYANIIEYRDYCTAHGFTSEAAAASLQAIELKAKTDETDFGSAKIYLDWLNSSGSRNVYTFAKDCIRKFGGDEKQYFSDFYDTIKGIYTTTGSRYNEFGEWHNNYIYQAPNFYYGNEYYALASDTDNRRTVIGSDGEEMFKADEIMSYSRGKNLVAAHHEDQLVYLNVNRQRKIVPYNASENKLLDYDYLGPYYGNIANFSIDGKWGYINANADIITDQYEYATPFIDGAAAVKQGGTWKFITMSDNQFVDLPGTGSYDDVMLDEYGCPFSYGYAYVKKSGSSKWSPVALSLDEQKNISLKNVGGLEFDDAKPFGVYGAVKSGDKWGFINADGEWALEPKFDDAKSMMCGLAPVKTEGMWGYADINGKVIIDARFDDAVPFNRGGIAAVKTGDYWRMIRLKEYAE